MSQLEPEGNTKNSGSKVTDTQYYRWCFTLKSDGVELSQLFDTLKEVAKKFTFQLEEGEEGKYQHYQGVFSLKTKERQNTLKNNLGFNKIHLERCKNWYKSLNYCQKNDTRIAGPWDEKSSFIKIIDKLYDWQERLEKILLSEPNDRSIYWVWEETGNRGKTAFCKYMTVKHKANYLRSAKSADIAFALPDDPKIVIIDIQRSKINHINYEIIECIKDGMVFSGKYESKMKCFNPPNLMIFANCEPDYNELSKDRWKVIGI